MPMHTKMLHKLNNRFGIDEIARTAKLADAFAPGKQLNADVVLRKSAAFYKSLQAFVEKMPGSMRESVRGVIYHALTSKPAKAIVFSWAESDWPSSVQAPSPFRPCVSARNPRGSGSCTRPRCRKSFPWAWTAARAYSLAW